MKVNPLVIMYHDQNRYYDIFNGSPELDTKRIHVENVLKNIQKLISINPLNRDINTDLLTLCAEHHDDGRVDQYRIFKKFCDSEASHQSLGVDRFYRWLHSSSFVSPVCNESVQILLDVMQYHGRIDYLIHKESLPYVQYVTAADDLENAASCVSYLLREVKDDAKNYIRDRPYADQSKVSDFVFDHFARGEKFDKYKYCFTYGEYVLFAATLMTSCIRRYKFARELLLQPGYGYSSVLVGYADIFSKTLSHELSDKAFKILSDYAKGK